MRRRHLLGTLGSTAVATVGCLGAGATDRVLVGAFPGQNPTADATLAPFEAWLGRPNDVVVLFYDAPVLPGDGERIRDHLTAVWDGARVPMVTWQPYLGPRSGAPGNVERVIADGEYDETIDAWATLLGDWLTEGSGPDRRLYFRPLPEMNGDWVPWSAQTGETTPADFVAAWRHVHDALVDAGLTTDRCQWIWNPSARDVASPPAEEYYPGDRYVDWVGIDGYNFGASQPWSEWQSPSDVFGQLLGRVRDLTDRPVAFPEFGSSSLTAGGFSPAAKRAWIRNVFDLVASEDVGMACWFNVDKETDWAVFGGARGTARYTHRNATFDVYEAYRDSVTTGAFQRPEPTHDRVLSNAAFRGDL